MSDRGESEPGEWVKDPLQERLSAQLRELEAAGRRRVPTDHSALSDLTWLCGNDYLGLASNTDIAAAAAASAARHGVGGKASRLVSGTHRLHIELESMLARWWKKEAAIFFGSGFLANTGVIPALAAPGDLIVSDALNHASLIDGVRLAKAERRIVGHADVASMDRVLAERPSEQPAWIVVEAIYSMDGDRAPLADIVEVAKKRNAWLIVDEAHSLGVVGPGGRGLAHELGLAEEIDVHIGTCGKSFGTYGAFVAGSRMLYEWLYNRARSFVFTTAPPIPIVCATIEALHRLEEGDAQARLQARMRWMAEELERVGWWSGPPTSAIFPLIVGTEADAMALSAGLLEVGFFVQAIRPPTVPIGTSRLRLTVHADLTRETIEQFANALAAETRRHGIRSPHQYRVEEE